MESQTVYGAEKVFATILLELEFGDRQLPVGRRLRVIYYWLPQSCIEQLRFSVAARIPNLKLFPGDVLVVNVVDKSNSILEIELTVPLESYLDNTYLYQPDFIDGLAEDLRPLGVLSVKRLNVEVEFPPINWKVPLGLGLSVFLAFVFSLLLDQFRVKLESFILQSCCCCCQSLSDQKTGGDAISIEQEGNDNSLGAESKQEKKFNHWSMMAVILSLADLVTDINYIMTVLNQNEVLRNLYLWPSVAILVFNFVINVVLVTIALFAPCMGYWNLAEEVAGSQQISHGWYYFPVYLLCFIDINALALLSSNILPPLAVHEEPILKIMRLVLTIPRYVVEDVGQLIVVIFSTQEVKAWSVEAVATVSFTALNLFVGVLHLLFDMRWTWSVKNRNKQAQCPKYSKVHPEGIESLPELTGNQLRSCVGTPLADGGSASVYRGNLNGAKIAIKFLKAEANMHGLEDYIAEVKILAALRHPCVVQIYAKCDEKRALIMELMEGGTLQDRLDNDNLPWFDRVRVLEEAAVGLWFLHNQAQPVLHRDMKPSNVLLTSDLQAKVSDMGLAKRLDGGATRLTTDTALKGTFHYLCPDYQSTGQYRAACDVFALGVTIAVTVTNESPAGIGQALTDAKEDGIIEDLIDNRPGAQGWNTDVALKLLKLAMKCMKRSTHKRPLMKQVVQELTVLRESAYALAPSALRTLSMMKRALECPISFELMEDPVLAEDGYTYEREAIEHHLRIRQSSPMTNLPMGDRLNPNHNLKSMLAMLQEMGGVER